MQTNLLRVEWGDQTSAGWTGSPVAPTVKGMLITQCQIKPGVKTERLMDTMDGTLYPAYYSYVKEVLPTFTIGGYVCAEDFPYWLDSLVGKDTPSGAGPYVYDYVGTGITLGTARIFTLINGQPSNEIYGLTGAMINKLTVKMASNQPWMWTAEGIGYQTLVDTLGAGPLADRTITGLALASATTITMDAVGGTVGTTAFATTTFEAEMTIENKRTPDQYVGSLFAASQHESRWDGSLKLHLELNSTTDDLLEEQLVAAPANSGRLFRFKYDNGLATTSSRIVQLDFGGVAEESPEIFKDKGGLVTFDAEFKGKVDTGAFANWFKASVTNNTSALA